MSSFAAKRKARKIRVHDDEEDDRGTVATEDTGPEISSVVKPSFKKPPRKTNLRQITTINDDTETDPTRTTTDVDQLPDAPAADATDTNLEEDRPILNRAGSSFKKKKKPKSSRPSFIPGEIISGEDAEALEYDETFTVKKGGLGRKVLEANAFSKSLQGPRIPIRSSDEDDRPVYSKNYLEELKSSTPSTPKDLGPLPDEEGLDASELEGATVVDIAEKFGTTSLAPSHIPTEAEIREKKERRSRLAHEQDFISLNDDDDDRQLSTFSRKPETRLVRDDEDFAEGFDEYVEDGGISLGKRAEREARRKQRAEMASLIHDAEGSSGEDTDESEAERLEAYEAAQTRAGMDGLRKSQHRSTAPPPMPKAAPLPNFADALEKFLESVQGAEQELAVSKHRLAELMREKEEIITRRAEVQKLLKQAGEEFATARGEDPPAEDVDPMTLLKAQAAVADPFAGNRGLESFGNTPTLSTDAEE